MDDRRWSAVLSRIARQDAAQIDDIIRAFDPSPRPTGRDIFPPIAAVLLPQARLKRRDAVCIGIRVAAELPDAADRAMRLAALAMERNVEVIVLAWGDASGLERFGFRTERITGDTEAARASCEDQVRRFWNIDLVL